MTDAVLLTRKGLVSIEVVAPKDVVSGDIFKAAKDENGGGTWVICLHAAKMGEMVAGCISCDLVRLNKVTGPTPGDDPKPIPIASGQHVRLNGDLLGAPAPSNRNHSIGIAHDDAADQDQSVNVVWRSGNIFT